MSRKSRLLGIVSHAMLIQESINSNNYFKNKMHSLPELTIDITFTGIITPYIACESDNTYHKRSLVYGNISSEVLSLASQFATCANAKHHGSLVITAEFA